VTVSQDATGVELEDLVTEGLAVPALYRDLSTDYTRVEGLLAFLRRRSFCGLVSLRWPEATAYLLLFRGHPRHARALAGETTLTGEDALAFALQESTRPDGTVSVHPLPEELFPEAWWVEEQPEPSETLATPQAAEAALSVPESETAQALEPPQDAAEAAVAPPVEEPAVAEDAAVWARLVEGLYARFRRARGPALARRLEEEVAQALAGSGVRFTDGRLEGAMDAATLRRAAVRCAETIRRVAGEAFVERSALSILRELGVADPDPYRRALTG
jgi:hypothetical protein